MVQLGRYLENYLAHPWMIPRKDSDGIFIFTAATSSSSRWPLVAAAIETGTITKALVDLQAGKHVLAYRELMPLEQFAGIWGKMLGVQAKVDHDFMESSMGQIPDTLKKQLDETFAYAGEFGFLGWRPECDSSQGYRTENRKCGGVGESAGLGCRGRCLRFCITGEDDW